MYSVYNTLSNGNLSYNYESTDMISDEFTIEQDTKNFMAVKKLNMFRYNDISNTDAYPKQNDEKKLRSILHLVYDCSYV